MRKATNPVFVKLLFLFLTSSMTLFCFAQEESGRGFSLLPESWARKSALTKEMPAYPEEAVQQRISGVVHIKFETGIEGEVVRIKVKPGTEPLLAKAVAAAVYKWSFKTRRGQDGKPKPVISRLIFSFTLGADEPRVEFYNPGLRPPDVQHLGYYNSAKEVREWKDWQEVLKEPSNP